MGSKNVNKFIVSPYQRLYFQKLCDFWTPPTIVLHCLWLGKGYAEHQNFIKMCVLSAWDLHAVYRTAPHLVTLQLRGPDEPSPETQVEQV